MVYGGFQVRDVRFQRERPLIAARVDALQGVKPCRVAAVDIHTRSNCISETVLCRQDKYTTGLGRAFVWPFGTSCNSTCDVDQGCTLPVSRISDD